MARQLLKFNICLYFIEWWQLAMAFFSMIFARTAGGPSYQ